MDKKKNIIHVVCLEDVYVPRLGDIVEYNDDNKIKINIVTGTDKDWYCIKDHFDIDQCILPIKCVRKLVFRLPEEIILKLEEHREYKKE